MKISVLTLFPDIVKGPLSQSILKRAQDKQIAEFEIVNIRDYADNKHKTVDDVPYGGGPGMVMKAEPVYKAVQAVLKPESRVIIMSPAGKRFNQKMAKALSKEQHLIFICGHYEGIDERVMQLLNPLMISIGDYVLTNGALAACVVTDAVVRLLPQVLGNELSTLEESHETEGLVEYPQYTRPQNFMGLEVPEVLLSGHHKEIEKWRKNEALKRTREYSGEKPVIEGGHVNE